jgi:L-asparaginase II
MKITALTILKFNGDTADPCLLANASDVSNFGYFQRSSVREMIIFVSRTVGKRTPLQRRQSVEHEGKLCMCCSDVHGAEMDVGFQGLLYFQAP